jgi:EAL domain-containing protein (putative c-di-GMP-specific phosphodiesterase class I)/putative methionine-R-sulfoxide reductase with GAF domain
VEQQAHGDCPLRSALDFPALLRRIAERAVELVHHADGASLELLEDQDDFVHAAAVGSLGPLAGSRLPLYGSLSGKAVMGDETLRCDDSELDRRVNRAATRAIGLRSLICVPLRHEARAIGALTVGAQLPHAFSERDVEVLSQLAAFVTTTITTARDLNRAFDLALGPGSGQLSLDERYEMSEFIAHVMDPVAAGGADAAERVRSVLTDGLLTMHLQPIVELSTMSLAGAEALARFEGAPPRSPEIWFAEARHVGLGTELQLLAARRALEVATVLPEGAFVAINLDAHGLADEALPSLLASSPRTIVIELTESLAIDDYAELRRVLARLRSERVLISIDDAGRGYSSLSHVVQVAPDLIKLDIEIIRGIDLDPVRRSLVNAVVSFACETGSEIVAEGIEARDELEVLRSLGVRYGQGFLLGRPVRPDLFTMTTPLHSPSPDG